MRARRSGERSWRPELFRSEVYSTAPVRGKVIQRQVEGNAQTAGMGFWVEGRSIQ